jgi:predicted nucleic acid-binding Zn ribbon protein
MSGEPIDGTDPDNRSLPADAGRRLLARARSAPPTNRPRTRRRVDPDDQPWSGPGSDARDPALLDQSVTELVEARKWEQTLRTAGIPARWEALVGAEIAQHCRPERLDNGELTCVAESTAWATQIRLMSAQILARLATELGAGVVRRISVHGPTAPDWRHGPLRVRGRGPRDTYG